MTQDHAGNEVPWWSTAGASGPSAHPDPPAMLADLVTGAQAVVDWARRTMLDPHAGHADPAAHPQCLVCRANAALAQGTRPADAEAVARVDWIELDPPAP